MPNWIIVLNDPVNLVDPLGQKFTVGSSASLLLFDYSWDTSDPSKANLSLTPGQLYGGSVKFGWQSDKGAIVEPLMFNNIGLSKHLGVSFAWDLSKFTINLGWGRSLPITGSAPIEGDYSFGGWLYDLLHPNGSPELYRFKIQQDNPCN